MHAFLVEVYEHHDHPGSENLIRRLLSPTLIQTAIGSDTRNRSSTYKFGTAAPTLVLTLTL